MKSEKKLLAGIWGVVGLVCLMAVKVLAQPHWNAQTTFVTQDDGDSIRPFTVSVGTTTPVRVYFSTQTAQPQRTSYASPDRFIDIQNIQNFNLFCSTVNTVSATSGARFVVFSTATGKGSNEFQTYATPANIWCIFESAAGAGTKEVIGYVGYDSGD